jgi:hypothetical protein
VDAAPKRASGCRLPGSKVLELFLFLEDVSMNDGSDDTSKGRSGEEHRKARDLGGRRKRADRRSRTTAGTFPERRWLRHRRDGGDRRSTPFFNPREQCERRDAFKKNDNEEE